MRILRLSIANLKKKKYLAGTLILLTLLSVLFLNLGLILNKEILTTFPKCSERINGPDLFVVAETTRYETSFEEFFREDSRVGYMEKEDIIYMESTKNNINSLTVGAVVFNSDLARQIEPLHLLEEDGPIPDGDVIYLPLCLKIYGVSQGDSFTLTYRNASYDYRVAGFFETTYMGTQGYGVFKYYMPEESFQKLFESSNTGQALSVKLKEGLPKEATAGELKKEFLDTTDFLSKVGGIFAVTSCLSYSELQDNMMSIFRVPMVILIFISFITAVITSVIVYFKIKEEIDESMVNIGSMQAIGYTSSQIMAEKTAEFMILGAAGGIAGVILCHVFLPFTLRYGEGIIGIITEPGIYIGLNLFSMLIIFLLLTFSAILSAWKIRKITPVSALRKGVTTHHFGKNLFPLSQGKESLYLRLALKNMFTGLRQNIVTILIISMGVFSICIAVIMFANFGNDNSAIVKMTGMEIADIVITPMPHTDIHSLLSELGNMEGVKKTGQAENYTAQINDINVLFTVSDDFSITETLTVGKGSLPRYDNEVALTSLLLRRLHKKIGDSVAVTSNGVTKEFLITGSTAGTNNGSMMGLIRLDGLHRMNPSYKLTDINLYLEDTAKIPEFIDKLYKKYGTVSQKEGGETSPVSAAPFEKAAARAEEEIRRMLEQYGISSVSYAVMSEGNIILSGDSSSYRIIEVNSLMEYLEGQLASYAYMMKGLLATLLFVMFFIMGAIISITIRSQIRRQREEFGIYKALGYTTKELVRIISLNFTVNSVIGTCLGMAVCKLSANQLLTFFFSGFGLDILNFSIRPVWFLLIGGVTVFYVWILSTVKAYQIKKITVYELFTE